MANLLLVVVLEGVLIALLQAVEGAVHLGSPEYLGTTQGNLRGTSDFKFGPQYQGYSLILKVKGRI